MNNNLKLYNRIIGFAVFCLSLFVYIKTLPPTVVLWDVGEFCAAAYSLQVPHPPGAPLFLLIAKIFSMLHIFSDVAARMHLLSAIASALTCVFVYFIIVDLLLLLKDNVNAYIVFCSALIGTLALAFSKSFWFNAVEAEVYGLSIFFVGLILFLGIKYFVCSNEKTCQKYLLLIAYLIGLSSGVHLLAVLTVYPILLLWYFKNKQFKILSFLVFCVFTVIVFAVIYPGIISLIPQMLSGSIFRWQHNLIKYLPITLLMLVGIGIYFSIKYNKNNLVILLISFVLITVGYSTYIAIYLRANANPPMNQGNPNNIERLVSYINREQYGSAENIFNRRWNTYDAQVVRYHKKYSSDFDYMLKYQVQHMYFRYLGWNFIGIEDNKQDAGIDISAFYLIPFLFGLIGLMYQWRKQQNMALIFTLAFLVMGVILALYQNQQQPQPRERDYFYVGSFLVFAVWIAYGSYAILKTIQSNITNKNILHVTTALSIIIIALIIPFKMFSYNYKTENRSENYFAFDYAYNILQSCERDAILFTNGDNDTFPLWYLQDVEGIRRDIRIINLSLANGSEYIKQIKNYTPYNSKPVIITFADVEIDNIIPTAFQPSWMKLPVSKNIVDMYKKTCPELLDTSLTKNNVIYFYMQPTLNFNNMSGLRIQDLVVYEIIMSNAWQRPIYFVNHTPIDCQVGLHEYMQTTGLASKLVPFKAQNNYPHFDDKILRENLFNNTIDKPSKEPQNGFLWRGLSNSNMSYDEHTQYTIMASYRNLFMTYAIYLIQLKKDASGAIKTLDRMEQIISDNIIPMDYSFKYDLSSIYNAANDTAKSKLLLRQTITDIKKIIKTVHEPLTQSNPYIILYFCYLNLEMYSDAQELLVRMKNVYATNQNIDMIINELGKYLTKHNKIAK